MKLIDLLVQELPKRGGWPEGANYAVQDADGTVKFAKTLTYLHYLAGEWRSNENGYDWIYGDRPFDGNFVTEWTADDNHSAAISMARYECEISKKGTGKQSAGEWSGDGLPPVGTKVEFFINQKLGYRNDWIPDVGTEMEVVAHKTTTDGNDVAVCYWDEGGAGRSCCFVPESLKPLRTESDRKRDDAIKAILGTLNYYDFEMVHIRGDQKQVALEIYNAIAAGKIPGVKLED